MIFVCYLSVTFLYYISLPLCVAVDCCGCCGGSQGGGGGGVADEGLQV